MEDQRIMVMAEESTVPKPRKKKTPPTQKVSKAQTKERNAKMVHEVKKASKRGLANKHSSQVLQQPEKSTSDSLNDFSMEYRDLRRKYLMLEEESFELGKELNEVEEEIRFLEEEKLKILDELVVVEGLVDPSEFQPRGLHLNS